VFSPVRLVGVSLVLVQLPAEALETREPQYGIELLKFFERDAVQLCCSNGTLVARNPGDESADERSCHLFVEHRLVELLLVHEK
jgi:hypothetical protein